MIFRIFVTKQIAMFRIPFTVLMVVFITQSALGSIPRTGDCDSLVLSNGTVYAVKNVVATQDYVSFSYCDDATNTLHTAPWMQVNRIKKADGSELISPAFRPAKPVVPEPVLTKAEQDLEDQVEAVFQLSRIAIPLAFVAGSGVFLAIIALNRGKRLLKAIAGHPNEAKLKKMLKRARRTSAIILAVFAAAAIVLFSFIFYLDYLYKHM